MKTSYCTILTFLFSSFVLTISAQENEKARDTFNWNIFESNSTIHKDSIQQIDLQGNWIIQKINIYGDYLIGSKPINNGQAGTLEIKGDKWRNTLTGNFHTFRINQNKIIFNSDNRSDTAYINRITKKDLVISYKSDNDYKQYYYQK